MTIIDKIRQKEHIIKAAVYARYSSDNQRDESIDAQAETVRLIFSWSLSGYGYKKIAALLNERGCKTKRRSDFGQNSIRAILLNEKYTGVYIFNRLSSKDVDGKRNGNCFKSDEEIIRIEDAVPVIIDKDLFKQIKKLIDNRRETSSSNIAVEEYLLSGNIICGECKARYVGSRRFSGRNKKLIVPYMCAARHRRENCDNHEIRRDYIEACVLEQIHSIVADDTNTSRIFNHYNNFLSSQNSELFAKMDLLDTRIKHLGSEIDKLIELAANVTFSDSLAKKLEQLESEKSSAISEHSLLQQQCDLVPIDEDQIIELFQQAKAKFEYRDIESLRWIIRTFVHTVIVFRNSIVIILKYGKQIEKSLDDFLGICDNYEDLELCGQELLRLASTKGFLDLTVEEAFYHAIFVFVNRCL